MKIRLNYLNHIVKKFNSLSDIQKKIHFIEVVNRAQRCELHKLAVFLVGGEGSAVLCAELMLVAILVKYESARNFVRWRNGPTPVKWVTVAMPTTPARKPKTVASGAAVLATTC